MKKLDFELSTGERTLAELRPLLDKAIDNNFHDGLLEHSWNGEVLELKGPGAKGSVTHAPGILKLRARLAPPASWVHRTIRKKIEAALREVEASLDEPS